VHRPGSILSAVCLCDPSNCSNTKTHWTLGDNTNKEYDGIDDDCCTIGRGGGRGTKIVGAAGGVVGGRGISIVLLHETIGAVPVVVVIAALIIIGGGGGGGGGGGVTKAGKRIVGRCHYLENLPFTPYCVYCDRVKHSMYKPIGAVPRKLFLRSVLDPLVVA
jgi:hypothetical protein